MTEEVVIIYTDGSSLGNPGPGGYGIVMKYKDKLKEESKGFRKTTNNRMELMAVIEALKMLKTKNLKVIIYTDSQYVTDAINKGWLASWVKKNFKKVKNSDLWKEFQVIYPYFKLELKWIRGHTGNPDNERCDQLAKEAALYPVNIDNEYERQVSTHPDLFSDE